MNIISISQVVFLNHLSSFKQVEKEISGFKVEIPELTGKSKVLSTYLDNYKVLLSAINKYGQLLNKDISLIEKSSASIAEQDRIIGNTFNK